MKRTSAVCRTAILATILVGHTSGAADIPGAIDTHGCIACHAVGETRIGPAYAAIAARYADADEHTIEVLAQKIRHGGAGNWGVVPMIAHDTLEPAAARDIVRWILQQR
jgi:cytochrome c